MGKGSIKMGKTRRYYDRWNGKWVDGEAPIGNFNKKDKPMAKPEPEVEPIPEPESEVTPVPSWGLDWFKPKPETDDE